ncbi:cyclophilin-like fold protein [Escherichia coli]
MAFYAPWGNIALFYKDFAYSKGLVKLGHITGDIAVLRQPGPYLALIEQE